MYMLVTSTKHLRVSSSINRWYTCRCFQGQVYILDSPCTKENMYMRRGNSSKASSAYTRLSVKFDPASSGHWIGSRMLWQPEENHGSLEVQQHMNHRTKPFRITRNGNDISLLARLFPHNLLIHHKLRRCGFQTWSGTCNSWAVQVHGAMLHIRQKHGSTARLSSMQCAATALHCMR